jgi:uncharacterized protein YwqG
MQTKKIILNDIKKIEWNPESGMLSFWITNTNAYYMGFKKHKEMCELITKYLKYINSELNPKSK